MHVQRFGDQHHVFLGCKDRRIRMVQKDELIGEISTDRPPPRWRSAKIIKGLRTHSRGRGRFYKLLPLQRVDAEHEGGLVNQW